jgi:hypothetical protein
MPRDVISTTLARSRLLVHRNIQEIHAAHMSPNPVSGPRDETQKRFTITSALAMIDPNRLEEPTSPRFVRPTRGAFESALLRMLWSDSSLNLQDTYHPRSLTLLADVEEPRGICEPIWLWARASRGVMSTAFRSIPATHSLPKLRA